MVRFYSMYFLSVRRPAFILGYILDGRRLTVETHGVHVYVIDFTNSRMICGKCGENYFNAIASNLIFIEMTAGNVLFVNLATDEELFQGEGDLQFDIYRKMRDLNGCVTFLFT